MQVVTTVGENQSTFRNRHAVNQRSKDSQHDRPKVIDQESEIETM